MNDYFSLITPPIISASGCWAQHETQVTQLLSTGLGAVCLKSCTLEARIGNPQPNYYQLDHLSFNSIAYENMKILEHLLDDLNSYKIAPIFIEINLGCPNTNQGVLPGL